MRDEAESGGNVCGRSAAKNSLYSSTASREILSKVCDEPRNGSVSVFGVSVRTIAGWMNLFTYTTSAVLAVDECGLKSIVGSIPMAIWVF